LEVNVGIHLIGESNVETILDFEDAAGGMNIGWTGFNGGSVENLLLQNSGSDWGNYGLRLLYNSGISGSGFLRREPHNRGNC